DTTHPATTNVAHIPTDRLKTLIAVINLFFLMCRNAVLKNVIIVPCSFYLYSINHSSRKLSTGLASAARMACQLTVSTAISNAAEPATTNTHHWMSIRKAKSANHLFIPHPAMGDAMT